MPETALADFLNALRGALADGSLVRLVLSKPAARSSDLQRVDGRVVVLKGAPQVQLVETHRTRDVTRNVAPEELEGVLAPWLAGTFLRAHLATRDEELQLLVGKRGRATLVRARRAASAPVQPLPSTQHDRTKTRRVDPHAPWLHELGITTRAGDVVPAMARKYKQIDKFVEIVEHAVRSAGLATNDSRSTEASRGALDDSTRHASAGHSENGGHSASGRASADHAAAPRRTLRVVDFGCGKGYLTFAVHEHLTRVLGLDVETVGVELRPELVATCNAAASRAGLAGLRFEAGEIAHSDPGAVDVMIALHACDTATDEALHLGLRAGARVLVASPCCHKELRPQLVPPPVLAPLLRHGVHLGEEAEMLTDALRALLVEAEGYDVQVFEFVSLEHTSKNKLLLAVQRAPGADDADRRAARRAEADALAAHFGVREQRLATLICRGTAARLGDPSAWPSR